MNTQKKKYYTNSWYKATSGLYNFLRIEIHKVKRYYMIIGMINGREEIAKCELTLKQAREYMAEHCKYSG